jgi:hypothetical protein
MKELPGKAIILPRGHSGMVNLALSSRNGLLAVLNSSRVRNHTFHLPSLPHPIKQEELECTFSFWFSINFVGDKSTLILFFFFFFFFFFSFSSLSYLSFFTIEQKFSC